MNTSNITKALKGLSKIANEAGNVEEDLYDFLQEYDPRGNLDFSSPLYDCMEDVLNIYAQTAAAYDKLKKAAKNL